MKRILIPMGVVVVLMLNYTTLLFAQKDKSPSGMRMPPAKVVVAEDPGRNPVFKQHKLVANGIEHFL